MKIKASNGKTYEVSTAPPGGEHVVKLGSAVVGGFVIEPETTRITKSTADASERLLHEIADKFVDEGGGPVGIM
ncbi:MAG TPA: hypothetical protein VHB21_00820 [Minicystis sp.]|nr:hypothetical protein [Minicystis sp.]